MDHNNFDEIVGSKLNETQHFPFDEQQWKSVEAKLAEKKKRRPILWWYWGAAAAILLLVGLAYNNLLLQDKINALENQVEQINQVDISEKIVRTENNEGLSPPQVTEASIETNNEFESSEILLTTTKGNNNLEEEDILPITNSISFDPNPIINQQISTNQNLINNSSTEEIVEKNQRLTIEKSTTKIESKNYRVDRQLIADFDLLNNKNNILAERKRSIPEFSISKFRLRNKFGIKTFSTGISANAGWGLVNVNSSLNFSNLSSNDVALIGQSENISLRDNTGISGSQETFNFKWWGQLHFTKGLSLKTELGRRQIKFSTESNRSNFGAQIVENTLLEQIFSTPTGNSTISVAEIIQTEWTLAAGVSYSLFRKWKVHPIVSVLPEFSKNVTRRENFDAIDANAEAFSFTNEFSSSKLHLRSISNRIGLQGMIGKNLIWQSEFGYNIPIKIINPSLINKFQVGLNLGYIF